MERGPVGYEAVAVAGAATKKTMKKVMKTVSMDHVEFVLASKPTPRRGLRQELQPGQGISEERRRCYAIYDEIVSAKNDLLHSLQHKFRNDLATKGRVEVEVEVTDDESEAQP